MMTEKSSILSTMVTVTLVESWKYRERSASSGLNLDLKTCKTRNPPIDGTERVPIQKTPSNAVPDTTKMNQRQEKTRSECNNKPNSTKRERSSSRARTALFENESDTSRRKTRGSQTDGEQASSPSQQNESDYLFEVKSNSNYIM